MCDCKSYNKDTGETPNALLDISEHFFWESFSRPIVCIDECISEQIEMLWRMGIFTRGSCCGHNEADPNVVIESEKDIYLAKLMLPENFQILIWRLVRA